MSEPYAPLEVGMKVVCIETGGYTLHVSCGEMHTSGGRELPVVGTVYTVREIFPFQHSEIIVIRVVEIVNAPIHPDRPETETVFPADNFRPISSTDKEVEALRKIVRDVMDKVTS